MPVVSKPIYVIVKFYASDLSVRAETSDIAMLRASMREKNTVVMEFIINFWTLSVV